jgi:predicted AAA+ superfamily ATPase
MKYIPRQIESEIIRYLNSGKPRGIILAGIIGVGKTTLVKQIIEKLKASFVCFAFSGDDLKFRQEIAADTTFLLKTIRSKTSDRALVCIDEIQKTPEILDAVKLAFDEENISFIVTGSQPQYLLNQARQRLQRRARAFHLYPFSLNEIYSDLNLCDKSSPTLWMDLLEGNLPDFLLEQKGDWLSIYNDYQKYRLLGTIPLVYQEKTKEEKLIAITNIINRGYQPIAGLNQQEEDTILTEIARLNNREFTYQTILNKTHLKRREKINAVIEFYMQNGILLRRSRKLFTDYKQSYHVIYSFVDPGIVYYISPPPGDSKTDNGFDLESVVHSQINNWQNFYHFPLSLYYYVPYYVIPSGQIKYKTGSIDFLIETHNSIIPIEVKTTNNLNHISTPVIEELIQSGRAKYGIIFYQGAPWLNKKKSIYYLPLAML